MIHELFSAIRPKKRIELFKDPVLLAVVEAIRSQQRRARVWTGGLFEPTALAGCSQNGGIPVAGQRLALYLLKERHRLE